MRRALLFAHDLVVGQKRFLCRVGRGFAPLDLPVLIPRVKKRPSRRRLRALRVALRRGDIRGAGAFVPPADLQRPFPLSGRVTAAKQHPSGRLRRCPAGSAYADEERGTSSVNHDCRRNCRALLARAIRYQPVLLSL